MRIKCILLSLIISLSACSPDQFKSGDTVTLTGTVVTMGNTPFTYYALKTEHYPPIKIITTTKKQHKKITQDQTKTVTITGKLYKEEKTTADGKHTHEEWWIEL